MPQTLDAAAVRRWCAAGLTALRRYEHQINQLNIYPVPDGDTGTNLRLTLAAAARAVQAGERPAPGSAGPSLAGPAAGAGGTPVLRTMARAALLNARGNSGVIVAQLLRGFADALQASPRAGGRALAGALTAGVEASYAAVAEPVEGTILSVGAAAARAAVAVDSDDPVRVCTAAADAAATALSRTPGQLPVLAAAGVVDAGGQGLVVLLDALVEALTGTASARLVPMPPAGLATGAGAASQLAGEAGFGRYEYEVQYLLDTDGSTVADRTDATAVARLRSALARLGDSLVVVGTGDGTWHVHVHVNDVGAAIEAGVAAGRPHRISVTRFGVPAAPARPDSDPPPGVSIGFDPWSAVGANPDPPSQPDPPNRPDPPDPSARAAVVVAEGPGLAALFAAEGAAVVGARPSAGELLAAIRRTGAGQVVVLPNDPDARAAAAVAADEAAAEAVRVHVVPTRSPVQALAALAVRDQTRRFDDDMIAMAEAAGACRYAQVCWAVRDALTVAGRCRAGDVLALVEGEVHLIGGDLTGVSRQLLDRLLGGGGELVTLLLGAQAPAGLGAELTDHLTERWPFAEVQLHHGGQPHYPLVVGVE